MLARLWSDRHYSPTLLEVVQNDTDLNWVVSYLLHNYTHLLYHLAIPILGLHLKAYPYKMKQHMHKVFIQVSSLVANDGK